MERKPVNAAEKLARSFGFEPIDPAAKAGRVRAVFDSVAGRYDLMNDLMSLGVHRLWKEAVLDWLSPRPGIRHLDIAGGTGDIAERLLDRLDGQGRAVLADINTRMLVQGRDRALDKGWYDRLDFVTADAMALPFPDRSFDSATIAFGIRNVTHIEKALAEALRVLVPGGRFLCLEFSKVVLPVLDRVYDAYSFTVLPKSRPLRRRRCRELPLSGREHPPLPGPVGLRRADARGGLRAGPLAQPLRWGSPPSTRAGGSDHGEKDVGKMIFPTPQRNFLRLRSSEAHGALLPTRWRLR
jgi:demethylmenaquinone methyltransferase/2-methoxy-6-polyprenyl-1,4-benzoquinol methylase